ncbi:zinc uptake protein ZrgA [Vibrio sp. RC27]
MYKQLPLSILVGLALSTPSLANEEVRQHGAHVHGNIEMNIAQDGHDLLIEITSPGMDIVGFEHHPENEQDHKKIDNAVEILEDANKLVSLNSAANCSLETAHVHAPGEEHEEHDHEGHEDGHKDHGHDSHEDEHKDHDHDSHEGEHKDHDHDSHEEGHEGHDHEEGTHSEFTIEYTYHCEQISELKSLTTTWFTAFPTTHEIDVNVFTDKQQTAVELNADQPTVQL